jgi:hypothetical protein
MTIPSKRVAGRGFAALLLVVMTLALTVGAAQAITFGQPDGDLHPNVGPWWPTGIRTVLAQTACARAP